MVEFLKIRKVKDPQRDLGNAGIDVFVPDYSEGYMSDLKAKNPDLDITDLRILVKPQESVLIPLGLKTKFGPELALEAANKSGVATKKKLFVGASVVDSSYQGEVHAHFVNVGKEDQVIQYGDKIVQFIPRVIDYGAIGITCGATSEKFYGGEVTSRGEGGFGSTGTR